MKKASEYREHAKECRKLAAAMGADHQRDQLLRLADHWEKLAADRLGLVARHPELARRGALEEERSFSRLPIEATDADTTTSGNGPGERPAAPLA